MVKQYLKKRPYLPYIAPAMIIMISLTIFPTVFLYLISMTNYQLGWDWGRVRFVGLENYFRLFTGGDPDFWNAVYISLKFMVITTAAEMVFGFFIGKLLSDMEFSLKPAVFAILIVPIVMTPSIAGNIWKLMFNAEYGIINYLLNQLGISGWTQICPSARLSLRTYGSGLPLWRLSVMQGFVLCRRINMRQPGLMGETQCNYFAILPFRP